MISLASFRPLSSSAVDPRKFASQDGTFEESRIHKTAKDILNPAEPNTRDFTYFMLGNGRIIYASTARLALIKVMPSLSFSLPFPISSLTSHLFPSPPPLLSSLPTSSLPP